jgi:stage II sporulation protein D
VRFLAALSLVLTFAVTSAAAQTTPPADSVPGEAVFAVSGRGWGHGVGMSQYGALGQAKEGRTYDEILAYYYSGTQLGRAGTKEVRVLLTEGRRAITVSSAGPFRVVDAAGVVTKLPAGALVLTPALRVPTATIPVKGPLVVRSGKAPVSLDGVAYRGRFEVTAQNGFLRVVNGVGLEDYVQGVVAGEMPRTWPLEALKAQAVAARSYALKNVLKGKPYDLYADARSQVYGGIAAEQPESTDAVRATAGRVVTYDGEIASTYYFSTSGGKTASALDVFGFAVPYLVSRPDPWDKASPYHRWGPILIGARTVQAKLSATSRVLDASSVMAPSGRLRSLTLETLTGSTSVPASLVRTALGLRSTWITMAVLRLDRPRSTVEFGSPLRLTGVARNITSPQLTASVTGTTWAPVGLLARASDGTVSRSVQPTQTMRYRIEGIGASSAATTPLVSQVLLVRVAPRVRMTRSAEPGVLSGTVRPRVPGALVYLERQRGSSWTQVAETTAGESGAFRVEVDLLPGTYRARVGATAGLVEGYSPLLTVEG